MNENSASELVRDVFDDQASWYMRKNYAKPSSETHSFLVRRDRVYQLIGNEGKGRILDIGCGPGVTAEDLLKQGVDFYGVDVSKEMIDVCNKQFGNRPNAHFSVGAIEHMDFPDDFFDVIICMGVLEYLDDPDLAMKEMARVTKPGGIVLVTVPNWWCAYRIWNRTVYFRLRDAVKGIFRKRGTDGLPHREFSLREMKAMAKAHSLNVEDVAYYNFEVFFPPLNKFFPKVAYAVTKKLESQYRGMLRTLGTGFIVKARKAGQRESLAA